MHDVSGDQLRRIAFWLDWPPLLVVMFIAWLLPAPNLWVLVIVWLPVSMVTAHLSTVAARRIRRAAKIVDSADQLIATVQLEGLGEVVDRLRRR